MGLSSLAIVLNIIGQVYAIDLRLNQTMQEKLNLSRFSTHVARMQSQALQLREKDGTSRARFRFINFVGERPSFVNRQFINESNSAAGPGAVGAARLHYIEGDLTRVDLDREGLPPPVIITDRFGRLMAANERNAAGAITRAGWAAPASPDIPRTPDARFPNAVVPAGVTPEDQALRQYLMNNPTYEELERGEAWLTKEQIEGQCKVYLAEINGKEKELDMQLEDLRSRRTALTTQKEEFTKYVQQGIQSAFKNNYA